VNNKDKSIHHTIYFLLIHASIWWLLGRTTLSYLVWLEINLIEFYET